MDVDSDAGRAVEFQGTRYLFCSAGCQRKFEGSPKKYADSDGSGDQEGDAKSWRDYVPLIVLVALTLGAASAKQWAYPQPWEWMSWMHDFMGFFLIVFSMFKFFDLDGFAEGFQKYDLLAKRALPYAYLYPFLELALGLGYLSMISPDTVYIATIVLMGFGSLGVFTALAKGLDINCACMGTALYVPLSTVAVVEDLGMVLMAGAMLIFG